MNVAITCNDKSTLRNIIISSQHLDTRSTQSIEEIVSAICGLQYDPNPTIHLNHYMMLWNRKKDFTAVDLDTAAYKDFKITEWDAYVKGRRVGDLSFELPIFRAFYRLKRKTDLVTCGRNPGTFKEPLYILKENIGINEWPNANISKDDARAYLIEKLIAAFGVTYPVHISHITGIPTAEVTPYFSKLETDGKIVPVKVGKKTCYIHSSKLPLLEKSSDLESDEVRLISPMDILVRDQTWLKTFFDYSYTFEYFKKKGMKWPLSILVGNRFVGYFDCKMEWRTKRFVIKEKNIFDTEFSEHKGIERAVQELAEFHGAKEIVER